MSVMRMLRFLPFMVATISFFGLVCSASTISTALNTKNATTTPSRSLNESRNASSTITSSHTTTRKTTSPGSMAENTKTTTPGASSTNATTTSPRPSATSSTNATNTTPEPSTNTTPGASRTNVTTTTPGASSTNATNTTPGVSSTNATTTTTGASGTNTTNTTPGASSTNAANTTHEPSTSNATTNTPGASSTNVTNTTPGARSTNATTTTPGASSTNAINTTPGASSTDATTTTPGASSTNATNTTPGGTSTKVTTTTPGVPSTNATTTTPGPSSTNVATTTPRASSTNATNTTPEPSSTNATNSTPGASSKNATYTTPGASSTNATNTTLGGTNTKVTTTTTGASSTNATNTTPGASSTNVTTTTPRASSTNATNIMPEPSSTNATNTTPGASSTYATNTTPGGTSTNATTTTPGASSTNATTTTPGASSTNATNTTPGASSTNATTTTPGASSTNTTNSTPGTSSTNVTNTTPGASSTNATTTTPAASSTNATNTAPGASSTNATTTTPGGSTTNATTTTPGRSTTNVTTTTPGPSTTNETTKKNDCHVPQNISNGIVEYPAVLMHGSKAMYICNSGFQFYANLVNQSVSCLENGEWEPSVYNCTVKYTEMGTNCLDSLTSYHFRTVSARRSICRGGEAKVGQEFKRVTYDIDECARSPNNCHFLANCSNNIGSFSCKCRKGFKDKHSWSHGTECVDIDECADPGVCATNGTRSCVNVFGQYFCRCKEGYRGNYCENEIDECENRDSCGVNAICTNTPGSYFCRCNDTYPSGNPYIHCYENTIIQFEPKVDPVRGNTVKMTSHAVPFRYTYFGVQHYVFRAAMDGFISLGFQQVFDRYAPANSSEWVKSSHFNTAYDPAAIIAPLWSDLDTTNIKDAGLYVHYFSADETGNVIDSNAKKAFEIAKNAFNSSINDCSFEPKVLLEATWANVTVAFQALPPQKFVKRENATMQAILVSNGISTCIMFNYAQDEWNINPGHRRFGVAGYSNPNFTGNIIADRKNFTQLSSTSTNSNLKGRHIFNVTQGSADQMAFLQVEEDCRSFYKNESAWNCTARQNKKAYVCPCQEDFVKYDLSLHKVEIIATLGHGVDYPDKTACYQEWFFNFGGVKQTCCYQFGTISTSQYAGGFALFKDDKCGADVGYQKCCVESKRLCHLFYKMNPPNNCTGYEFPSFIG